MKILVASDLSTRSERALRRSFALARELGAALQVVHVVDVDVPRELRDYSIDWGRRALIRAIDELNPGSVVPATLDVVAAHPAAGINDCVDASRADLLVLGVHDTGTASLREFAQTTAGRILREGHVPVLLIKNDAIDPYRRVVIGVDFSVFSRAAIRQAFRIAPGARFHLLHAYHVPYRGFIGGAGGRDEVGYARRLELDAFLDKEMALLARHATEIGLSADSLDKATCEADPRAALHAECARLPADLVVVGTHGRTGLARAVFGSVAASILNAPPCDVLVARAY